MAQPIKHNVVALDSWVKPPPFEIDHDLFLHNTTDPTEIASLVKDATIIIVSMVPVSRATIEAAPNLQLVACNGTGTDHVDKVAARQHGVAVCHVPAQNTESVSEHAFALFFALRRQILPMHTLTIDGGIWSKNNAIYQKMGAPPRTNGEETLVLVGYGAIGKAVERIGRALGMQVLIAERKGVIEVRPGRTFFEEALKRGTLFILVVPLDDTTRNMFGKKEFDAMQPTALVVNVGRGGVTNEQDLVDALKSGKLAGAATDVFEIEPATKENCRLLDSSVPNLLLSPHVAWYSSRTIEGTLAAIKSNIEGFANGKPQNIVVPSKNTA